MAISSHRTLAPGSPAKQAYCGGVESRHAGQWGRKRRPVWGCDLQLDTGSRSSARPAVSPPARKGGGACAGSGAVFIRHCRL